MPQLILAEAKSLSKLLAAVVNHDYLVCPLGFSSKMLLEHMKRRWKHAKNTRTLSETPSLTSSRGVAGATGVKSVVSAEPVTDSRSTPQRGKDGLGNREMPSDGSPSKEASFFLGPESISIILFQEFRAHAPFTVCYG